MADIRFLADESCDFAVVRALRETGYDAVVDLVNNQGESLRRSFVVVAPGQIRITQRPAEHE